MGYINQLATLFNLIKILKFTSLAVSHEDNIPEFSRVSNLALPSVRTTKVDLRWSHLSPCARTPRALLPNLVITVEHCCIAKLQRHTAT